MQLWLSHLYRKIGEGREAREIVHIAVERCPLVANHYQCRYGTSDQDVKKVRIASEDPDGSIAST